MARALVTGAAGFIGTPLVRTLRATGVDVIALGHDEGDVADAATFAALPDVDHVFHLAARTFVPDSWNDPTGFLRTNVLGTSRVLDYCRRAGAPCTYVSAYLYGASPALPVRESEPVRPNNPYALSKHLAEQLCAFHAEAHQLAVTVVRPFNAYGPRQGARFLIPEIVAQVIAGGPVRVRDLAPRRDFVHVDDVVDALVRAMATEGGYRVFNVGSGESVSVGAVIELVQRAAGTTLPVECGAEVRRSEIPDVYADISAARAALGWAPATPLFDGLARLIQDARSAGLVPARP